MNFSEVDVDSWSLFSNIRDKAASVVEKYVIRQEKLQVEHLQLFLLYLWLFGDVREKAASREENIQVA